MNTPQNTSPSRREVAESLRAKLAEGLAAAAEQRAQAEQREQDEQA